MCVRAYVCACVYACVRGGVCTCIRCSVCLVRLYTCTRECQFAYTHMCMKCLYMCLHYDIKHAFIHTYARTNTYPRIQLPTQARTHKHRNEQTALSYCSCLAPAYFNDDEHLDFMIHINAGAWPRYRYSLVGSFHHRSQ